MTFGAQEVQAIQISRFHSDASGRSGSYDLVELFNNTGEKIDLSQYRLEDTATSKPVIYQWENKGAMLPPDSRCTVEVGNRLNNSGDVIFLKKGDQVVDCVSYKEKSGQSCTKTGESSSDLLAPDCQIEYESFDSEKEKNAQKNKKEEELVETGSQEQRFFEQESNSQINLGQDSHESKKVMGSSSASQSALQNILEKESVDIKHLKLEDKEESKFLEQQVTYDDQESQSNSKKLTQKDKVSSKDSLIANIFYISGGLMIVGGVAGIFLKGYNEKYFENQKFD